jgi:hypothetical protein
LPRALGRRHDLDVRRVGLRTSSRCSVQPACLAPVEVARGRLGLQPAGEVVREHHRRLNGIAPHRVYRDTLRHLPRGATGRHGGVSSANAGRRTLRLSAYPPIRLSAYPPIRLSAYPLTGGAGLLTGRAIAQGWRWVCVQVFRS